MNNMFRILFLSLFFVSCGQKVEPSDIAKINGYWQIKKVVFEEGEDKDYKMNESYDYFKMINNNGIRKKVMPQLNGSFLVNDSYENVKVRFDKDKVYLDYATAYAKWSEELVALTDDELVLKNTENKEYHYKKAGPINLTGDGEETK